METIDSKKSWIIARNIFIIVIIFHFINNLFWIKSDGYVQHGCHSVWLEEKAFKYSEILRDDKLSILEKCSKIIDLFKLNHGGYAFQATNFNLTSLLLAFPMAAGVDGHTKLFLINTLLFGLFLLILLALYYLGKIVFNRISGAWSAVVFSFYPGIIGLSRKVNTELLVTLFVIISGIVFLRWNYLPRVLRWLLLFTIFSLGVLSGGLFLVFFVPLFLLHTFFSFFRHGRKAEGLLELIVFLVLVLLFFNFYFNGEYSKVFLNLKKGLIEVYDKLTLRSKNFIGNADYGTIELFLFAPQDSICSCTQTTNVGMNIETFLFYIMEMMYYISPLLFLLAAFSFFSLIKDKRVDFYKRMFLGTWVIFGYLLLSLFHIKWGKFITPALPALAMSSGIFIDEYSKKIRITQFILLCIGIATILYYSYFRITDNLFLEKLNEGFIAHRPLKSRFVEAAEGIATGINHDAVSRTKKVVNIVFLDKESPRFGGNMWVTDMSVRVNNLIKLFLKKKYRGENFWRLSNDFYNMLPKQDFVIVIAQQKIASIANYLYPTEERKEPKLKFETLHEDRLMGNVFVYLIKILKE